MARFQCSIAQKVVKFPQRQAAKLALKNFVRFIQLTVQNKQKIRLHLELYCDNFYSILA